MTEAEAREKGKALLRAVERIVERPERIQERVDDELARARERLPDDADEAHIRKVVERKLITRYSNYTAAAGGAAALPSLVPGIGTLTSLIGGSLVDMTLCLKFEVELILSLASLRGYDIEDVRERHFAYLLAAIHTYEASGGRNPIPDLLKTELDAVWNYTPRQLSKLVTTLFVRLVIHFAGRGLARAIPLVGMVVSSTTNKALTARVGRAAVKSLDERAAGRTRRPARASSKRPAVKKSTSKSTKTAAKKASKSAAKSKRVTRSKPAATRSAATKRARRR